MVINIKKSISALLLASMTASTPLSAVSYTGIGEITSAYRDTVGDGLRYSEYKSTDEDGKGQKSYIFEYTPGGVLPIIDYGSKVYGMDRLASLVKNAEENGNYILGGLNGDFYSMQTGVPLGVMIDGGELITTDNGNYALGFFEDGTAMIGKPSTTVTLTNLTRGGDTLKIGQINKYPTVWGVYMTTDDFAKSTKSSGDFLEITLRLDGELKPSSSVSGIILSVKDGTENSEIPEGAAVISVAKSYESYSLFSALSEGDMIRIDVTCAEGWDKVKTAVGGGDLILKDGVMPEGIIDESHEKVSNPRTAVGIKADGRLIFLAVDGRSDDARGLKLEELSAVMAELGCVTALNLDGGGSTTVMMRPALSTEISYKNPPIDTNYRALANGILFASKYLPDGVPGRLAPTLTEKYLLRGSTASFEAAMLDKAYTPLGVTIENSMLTADFAESYHEDAGKIEDGKFIAGTLPGHYYIKVSSTDDSTITGETAVNVTSRLDNLELARPYIKLIPGLSADIDIIATYAGERVLCDSASFYYTLNGTHIVPKPEDYPTAALFCDYGYLDKEGKFQSFGGVSGQVELGVWFDEFVRYVTIDIGDSSHVLADFEVLEGESGFILPDGTISGLTPGGYKSGGALGINYTYTDAVNDCVVSVKPATVVPLFEGAKSIKIHVNGDIPGTATALLTDADGNEYVIPYQVTKDYSRQLGWRELTAEIPELLTENELFVASVLNIHSVGSGSGTLLVDNPLVYYGRVDAPSLAGLEAHWAGGSILTLHDMTVIEDSDCVSEDGALYYAPDSQLTRGEFAKLLVRYLGIDHTKYITEGVSLDTITPVDKIPYIRAAIAEGLMGGRGILEDGSIVFDPMATITREEAFKVFGTILDSEEAVIAFADYDTISSWATQGIAKCVGAGLINGYEDNTLRPRATISRSQMASLLMRMD